MYEVRISARARKSIKKFPEKIQNAVIELLKELAQDPFLNKPLTREMTGSFAYKIGVYRVIYKVNVKDKIVNIISAGHRSQVYN